MAFTTAPSTANEGDTKNYVYTVTDPGTDLAGRGRIPDLWRGQHALPRDHERRRRQLQLHVQRRPAVAERPDAGERLGRRALQRRQPDGHGRQRGADRDVQRAGLGERGQRDQPVADVAAGSVSMDTTAGFQYAFDCGDGGGYGAYSATSTASCPTTDSGSRTVKGKIKDKDNGETEYTATVTVNNVAPTAALTNNGPVNEGSPATVSFSSQFDPSSADTAAGFHYAYDCSGGSLAGATYAGSGTSASPACTFPDNGTLLVRARIIDQDNGYGVHDLRHGQQRRAHADGSGQPDRRRGHRRVLQPGILQRPGHGGRALDGERELGRQEHRHLHDGRAGTDLPQPHVRGQRHLHGDRDRHGQGHRRLQHDHLPGTVSNAAPTATLANNSPVNEGSPATITFPTRPIPRRTTAAGFHYAYSCSNGDLSGATYANTAGSTASTTCTYDDGPSTRTVKARIIDKDDGFSEYTTVVTVDNVAPTASLSNNGPVNGASPATISFIGSARSVHGRHDGRLPLRLRLRQRGPVGLHVRAGQHLASSTCSFVDNGTYTVKARIIDKDGGFTEYTTVVTVNNVVPTVTAPANQSSDEGENKSFSLGCFSDPGTADNPWTVSVNWGDLTPQETYTVAAQGAISRNHTYDDNGTYTVTYTVTDKDGGVSTPASTFQVTVNNVAPTATLANDGPINEGGSVNVTFSAASDPSNADTSAGFHYAFSCTNGDLSAATYAGSGTSATTSCTFNDNGTRTVKARIIDKDGGFTEYTTDVTVNNVAPTAALANNGPVSEGSPATVSFSAPVRSVLRRHGGRLPLRVRLQRRLPGRGDLRRQRYLRVDGLHVRGQRHVPRPGPDHRQGQRLHGVHDLGRGHQRRADPDEPGEPDGQRERGPVLQPGLLQRPRHGRRALDRGRQLGRLEHRQLHDGRAGSDRAQPHVRRQRHLHGDRDGHGQGRRALQHDHVPGDGHQHGAHGGSGEQQPGQRGQPGHDHLQQPVRSVRDGYRGGLPLRVQLQQRRPVRRDVRDGGIERLDDVHVRRWPVHSHREGPDHRQGRRLHRVHDGRHGGQRGADGEPRQQRPGQRGHARDDQLRGQLDPSSADTTAGFHYAYACDNGDLSGVELRAGQPLGARRPARSWTTGRTRSGPGSSTRTTASPSTRRWSRSSTSCRR